MYSRSAAAALLPESSQTSVHTGATSASSSDFAMNAVGIACGGAGVKLEDDQMDGYGARASLLKLDPGSGHVSQVLPVFISCTIASAIPAHILSATATLA